jgi:hypothetical protein
VRGAPSEENKPQNGKNGICDSRRGCNCLVCCSGSANRDVTHIQQNKSFWILPTALGSWRTRTAGAEVSKRTSCSEDRGYNGLGSLSHLLFIRESTTAQQYVQEVLEPVVAPYIRQGAELQIPFSNKMMPRRKGFFKVS